MIRNLRDIPRRISLPASKLARTSAVWLLLCLGAVSPCIARAQQSGEAKQGGVTAAVTNGRDYMGRDGSYRLVRPEGWMVREDAMPGIDVAFFCEEDPGVNFTVAKAAAGGESEFSDMAAMEIKETFRKSYPAYNVTAEEWRTLDGARAYCLSARYAPAGVELQNKQVMFIKAGTFFTLTYTSTPALFMKRLADFEHAVESFRISGDAASGMLESPQQRR